MTDLPGVMLYYEKRCWLGVMSWALWAMSDASLLRWHWHWHWQAKLPGVVFMMDLNIATWWTIISAIRWIIILSLIGSSYCHWMDHHHIVIKYNDALLVGSRSWHWQAKLGGGPRLGLFNHFFPRENAKNRNLKQLRFAPKDLKSSSSEVQGWVQLQTWESACQKLKSQNSEI